jgi:hypothetical protein
MGMEENQSLGPETIPAQSPESRGPLLARLTIATVLVQLLFWIGVKPLLYSSPTLPPLYAISDVQEATLAGPEAAALAKATFAPTALPWSSCCGPGYRALRFNLNLPEVPEHGIAVVPQVDADNLQIRINGQLVLAQGRMGLPRPTYEVNVKRVIHLPPAVFHTGPNRVEYVMVRQVLPYFDVTKPLFADYAVAWPLFKFREFVLTDFEYVGIAVGAVIVLVALALLLRSTQRGLAMSLLLLASSWSLLTQFYFWVDPPFSADTRMLYYFALTNALPVAWLNFSNQWTGKPFRWTAVSSALVYVLCMGATLWSLR